PPYRHRVQDGIPLRSLTRRLHNFGTTPLPLHHHSHPRPDQLVPAPPHPATESSLLEVDDASLPAPNRAPAPDRRTGGRRPAPHGPPIARRRQERERASPRS